VTATADGVAVLGLDGCRGGWMGALVVGGDVRWLRLADVSAALAVDAAVVGVDMPIGLPATGRRECDLLAKKVLGAAHPRVFLTPPRGVLASPDYTVAGELHRGLTGGAGMSVQTWHIVDRIAEVDEAADDARLVEVHPELSFTALAGRVLAPKRTAEGRAERLAALDRWLPGAVGRTDLPSGPLAIDALDALVAAWSAQRHLNGTARVQPAEPPRDGRGRPMRIVT
jgi:predicted RNase H-like nuclease